MTLASPSPLVFQRFHLLAFRLAALLCAICILVLPTPSVDPSARSEGLVLASAQQDRMMKTLAPAVPPSAVAGSGGRSNWRFDRICSLVGQCLFSNRTRHASVCGPNTTQPLQPDVAPCLATTPVVKYTRRCPGRPWSCCVTIVAFKFSALPFQGSPRTFFNSLITNLSSVARGATISLSGLHFRENDVFACHWCLANPDFMAPSLIQIACWHGCCTCTSLFLEWQHLALVRFPKTRTNAVLPSFFT